MTNDVPSAESKSNSTPVLKLEGPKGASKVGRNDPCPCGSGKKHKRCCGLNSEPTGGGKALQELPADAAAEGQRNGMPGGMDPFAGFNPEVMSQMMGAFQRLPKGQLQKMQALMQKAMRGKDITRESKEFERSLPKDFQEMFRSLATAQEAMQQSQARAQVAEAEEKKAVASAAAQMTEEQARELVQKAAEQGKIAKTEAAKLLGAQPEAMGEAKTPVEGAVQKPSAVKKFWKQLAGKK